LIEALKSGCTPARITSAFHKCGFDESKPVNVTTFLNPTIFHYGIPFHSPSLPVITKKLLEKMFSLQNLVKKWGSRIELSYENEAQIPLISMNSWSIAL